jgi:hypothetical protein
VDHQGDMRRVDQNISKEMHYRSRASDAFNAERVKTVDAVVAYLNERADELEAFERSEVKITLTNLLIPPDRFGMGSQMLFVITGSMDISYLVPEDGAGS